MTVYRTVAVIAEEGTGSVGQHVWERLSHGAEVQRLQAALGAERDRSERLCGEPEATRKIAQWTLVAWAVSVAVMAGVWLWRMA